MSRSIDAHVRLELVADWMLHTLLPSLLGCAALPNEAAALRNLPLIETAAQLRDGYAIHRTVRVLHGVRGRLIDALSTELRWASPSTVSAALRRHDRRAYYTATGHPPLRDLSEFVAGGARTSNLGRLLQSCMELAIGVVVLRHDNDEGVQPSAATPELAHACGAAMRKLVARAAEQPARATAGDRPRIVRPA